MSKYRFDLPQHRGGVFLTDGGMETTLIFQHGVDLPHFAAFVLMDSAEGRGHLTRYYESYLAIARDRGTGFVLDSPTWRANADWGEKLGYDASALKSVNIRSIEFLSELRAAWEQPILPCVISGAIGPRGDGYKAGNMDAGEAEDYHTAQISAFKQAGADMVAAYTLNSVNEAIGVARAAKAQQMPVAISFTVETDGRLVKGETLREAIETVDRETRRNISWSTARTPLISRARCKRARRGRNAFSAFAPMRRPKATPSSMNPPRSTPAIPPISVAAMPGCGALSRPSVCSAAAAVRIIVMLPRSAKR